MRKIAIVFWVIVSCITIFAADYTSTELFKISWGNKNDQDLPYGYNELGDFWGPYQQYVDSYENIYLAYPTKDFRKYGPSGELVFKKKLRISNFAVDDSQNIYFTVIDPNRHHILEVLNKNGEHKKPDYTFSLDNQNRPIDFIAFKNGKIVISSYPSYSGEISNNGIEPIPFLRKNPMDSKGIYYQTETSMARSLMNKQKSQSYNNPFINLLKLYIEAGNLIKSDTISLDICSLPHKSADVIQIDGSDNIYIWISHEKNKPYDLVILDSNFIIIDRKEMNFPGVNLGLNAKPFIRHDGTIYEFRDLDDGLHVIRWSRKK